MDLWVLIVGLVGTAVGLGLAGRRVVFLFRMITHGQPAPDRIAGVTGRIGLALKTQLVEVFGQKKLLKWSIPGTAHFFVFWAFLILGTVYVEAYGALLTREPAWRFLFFGTFKPLGFLQDFIAVMCLLGLVAFWQIRLKNSPAKLERKSRFFGSHLGGAYLVLFMIFNVIWTLFLFRGAVIAHELAIGEEGYGKAAFVSYALGTVLPDSKTLIGVGLLLHIGIMLVFLVEVVNSKHLHIFVAPLNVLFGRRPVALGAVKPLTNAGVPVTLDDLDDLDEDAKLGVGAIEDFSWKGLLDMATCTECGRCQSQCPAWNTEKPLSPKLLIMNLRDHALAKTPYLLASEEERAKMPQSVLDEAERPLVGETEGYAWEPEGGAIIDNDVLWSCVTCGACVNQCPVDIEHVDHIIDMRRYQVLVEANFPAELNQLFKGMENKGNPWNMSASARLDWAKDLPFDVKVVGEDVESLDEVEWLFWVGCAGAYEDRQKKTTRAVAELLDMAGVSFAVLGNGETCTGDQARRAGNEFLFQQLGSQNAETFKEFKVKKVVSTCAHCFNTLKNEYAAFGVELEVTHHTQLLNRLVREGKLTPVKDGAGAAKRSITYHDPCYIGRHNGVYSPPRELLQVLPGAEYVEMERHSERSFCCGAGGARMWMEENIGERINENRTNEAVGTGADQIAVGCPFCRVMLSDGLTSAQAKGTAREEVEVLDVAQMLLASVKGEPATRARAGSDGSGGSTKTAERPVETKAEPEAGDVTVTENTVTETADAGPAAKASGGSSLFDLGGDEPADAPAAKSETSSGGSLFDLGGDDSAAATVSKEGLEKTEAEPAPKAAEPSAELGSGGSLFDIEDGQAEKTADEPKAEPESEPEPEPEPAAKPAADLGSGGSLFDIQAEEPAAKAEPEPEPEPKDEAPADPPVVEPVETPAATAPEPTPAVDLSSGGSLFDIAAPEAVAGPATTDPTTDPETEREPEPEPEPVPVPVPEQAQTLELG
ncbi:heterodisulfide reductase-related iron-sulfur binding cluster [Nocardioides sp.]|uniref:heterodisulfide reductase-related iron-sulfur binding cluster n=1 Tax=Nocardioides sp. TaxID=35761 RepID=UPI0025E05934|nr:heterodisulfide reductase-related iron-sulfur binding cluster [Nocardioides sp.]